MVTNYEGIKLVVMNNAYLQATRDADNIPAYKVPEIVSDPTVLIDVSRVLQAWSKGSKANSVFTGLSQKDIDSLTEEQRNRLIKYWIDLFPTLVIDKLKKRLQGGLA